MTANPISEPCDELVLKPCPFCGDAIGPHAEQIPDAYTKWGVHCPNGLCPTAGLWLAIEPSKAEAIAAWNTRAIPELSTLQDKIRRLEEALRRAELFIRDIATTDTIIMESTLEAEADEIRTALTHGDGG